MPQSIPLMLSPEPFELFFALTCGLCDRSPSAPRHQAGERQRDEQEHDSEQR